MATSQLTAEQSKVRIFWEAKAILQQGGAYQEKCRQLRVPFSKVGFSQKVLVAPA